MENLHDTHHQLPSTALQYVDSYYDRSCCSDGQKDAGNDGQGGRNVVYFHSVHDDLISLYGQALSLEAREDIGDLGSNMIVNGNFV